MRTGDTQITQVRVRSLPIQTSYKSTIPIVELPEYLDKITNIDGISYELDVVKLRDMIYGLRSKKKYLGTITYIPGSQRIILKDRTTTIYLRTDKEIN